MSDVPDRRAETNDPVFISYSRANTAFARDLYARLQALGFKLWRDRSEMEAGADWWLQIKDAIDKASTMVLVMSPKSLASPVVAQEWRYARQVGTRVIPVVAEDVDFNAVPRWMGRMDWLDFRDGAPERDLIWSKFIHQLNTPYQPVRVPFMVDPLPPDFVPRGDELEAIVGHLLDSGGEPVGITAALRGAGGYGKTTLARAICHDERIQQAFDGGILWVELGEQPGDPIGRILDLIVVLSGERPPVTGLEAARTRLAELLADKDILMVIDDVWDSAHLKPFLVNAPRCARLITTRRAETLPTGALRTNVDAMRPDQAVTLLAAGLPDGDHGLQPLATRLGEWPLLLKLANGVLRSRIDRGQSLPDALDYLNKALDRRGLTAFDQTDSEERSKAVATTIGVSLDLLADDERDRYGELAIFPEDVDVPLAALEKLWGLDDFDTEALCEKLDNLSLLLRFDLAARTIRLHDVIRAYLIGGHAETQGLHARFLDAYRVARWAELPHDEPYLWDWLAYHLVEAGRGDQLVETVLDLGYLSAKTLVKDAFAAEADLVAAEQLMEAGDETLGTRDGAALRTLRRAFANMSHILNDCGSLPDVMATLHSRLRHLPEFATASAALEPAIPRPYIIAWRPLPDLPHPALVRTLAGHRDYVRGCAFSPDGRFIASASEDHTLRLWDADTGAELRTLEGHTDVVNACAFSPDGRFILSASYDWTLRLWDASTGAELRTLEGHTNRVTDCAFSPDGRFILSASYDNTLKLWDAATGAELRTLAGHRHFVNTCAFSPDGRFVVSAAGDLVQSDDNTLRLWDAHTGAELRTFEGHTGWVYGCAFSPDGRFILSASDDHTLRLWDTATGDEVRTLVGHEAPIESCAFSPDGRFILSASWDNTLRLWDAGTGAELRTLTGHTHWVYACAFSPDGRFILSASFDNTLKLWDAHSGAEVPALQGHTALVHGCAFSPDGRFILSASADRTLKLWDTDTGAELRTLEGHTDMVHACAFSPDGRFVVSAAGGWFGSPDTTLRLWDAQSGAELRTFEGHTAWVNGCAFSPDGRFILSASEDHTLRLWDAATGAELRTLKGHTDGVYGCAFSPDGRFILSASHDHTLRLWDAQSGAELRTLEGHTGGVYACAFSPDGRFILSASADTTLRLWDAQSGAELRTFEGHTHWVYGCAFSPDGSFILSASGDNTLRLWDAADGRCLAALHVDARLYACAFHPDGEHIIAGGDGGLYWLRLVC